MLIHLDAVEDEVVLPILVNLENTVLNNVNKHFFGQIDDIVDTHILSLAINKEYRQGAL